MERGDWCGHKGGAYWCTAGAASTAGRCAPGRVRKHREAILHGKVRRVVLTPVVAIVERRGAVGTATSMSTDPTRHYGMSSGGSDSVVVIWLLAYRGLV